MHWGANFIISVALKVQSRDKIYFQAEYLENWNYYRDITSTQIFLFPLAMTNHDSKF